MMYTFWSLHYIDRQRLGLISVMNKLILVLFVWTLLLVIAYGADRQKRAAPTSNHLTSKMSPTEIMKIITQISSLKSKLSKPKSRSGKSRKRNKSKSKKSSKKSSRRSSKKSSKKSKKRSRNSKKSKRS